MDQWLVHKISPEIYMDQWRSKFSRSFSLDRYWSIECSSLILTKCSFGPFGHFGPVHFPTVPRQFFEGQLCEHARLCATPWRSPEGPESIFTGNIFSEHGSESFWVGFGQFSHVQIFHLSESRLRKEGVLWIRNTPMEYCWEFHDQLWEALSGTNSEKRDVPSRTGGESILETLWKPQMPWIIGFGASQPYSRGKFQETLWKHFRGLSGIFPEFLPESPSRTGGMAHWNNSY